MLQKSTLRRNTTFISPRDGWIFIIICQILELVSYLQDWFDLAQWTPTFQTDVAYPVCSFQSRMPKGVMRPSINLFKTGDKHL